ncbi:DNA methyltransferase [Brachyspira hyodysenteriae]|uniref:DNA methyltransferase n=1 Tax=Brachyspira hyodysenteriae TaxID=159 RepID=UPI00063DC0BC|nr:DNA methyltransferase [Brachyspira hyodysenteriae]KLI25267.1 DNA methyltransferase [Brachyspira hyodysenteriae]TVL72531.1 DNA methyltransferase [Brachyspira hyodysenteriae]TVL84829.1 DNA methyltransferase [Brachyspira hyodysenteriae]
MKNKNTLNELTTKEWAKNSRSIWNDLSSPRSQKALIHGATFPKKLSDRIISIYSKETDFILDPFLGTGTTAISALEHNRNIIGFELANKFYNMAMESILEYNNNMFKNKNLYCNIKNGDCIELIEDIEDNTIQLTLTSPPYANLIHKVIDDRKNRHKKSAFVIDNNATTKIYSNDNRDLGNMEFDVYIKNIKTIMKKIFKKTKINGYNIWIVKDYRDTKNKIPYVDLHSSIANAGIEAGFKYHDLIIWDQNERRRLVLLGYPSVFYVNQNHSFIVVLRKINEI